VKPGPTVALSVTPLRLPKPADTITSATAVAAIAAESALFIVFLLCSYAV